MKKSDAQTSSYTASDEPEKPSASSLPTMQQFHADWSQFETVFARGLLPRISHEHIVSR